MTKGTLVFALKDGKVLLGMKRRGFGAGKWNGFGGKAKEGEDIRAAALRELEEECGLKARPENLDYRATLVFRSAYHGEKFNWDVDVFIAREWEGEPQETEEMTPAWHLIGEEPFTMMWPDDPHWLPRVLRGEKIKGEFHFDPSGENFEKIEVEPLA